MQGFSDDLRTFISISKEALVNKNHIENKVGYVMTNAKFYENLRHAFSHLINALDMEIAGNTAKSEQAHRLYSSAIDHIDNIDVNGYEFLAGYFLNELRVRLEKAGLYVDTGNAETLREQALRHLDKGRDLRPVDKKGAMDQFEKCIDLCIEAKTKFAPVSKFDKRNLRINIFTMVFAGIALTVSIISVLIMVYK
jgi:hypothetical protein